MSSVKSQNDANGSSELNDDQNNDNDNQIDNHQTDNQTDDNQTDNHENNDNQTDDYQNTFKKYIDKFKELIQKVANINKFREMIAQTIEKVSKSRFLQFSYDGNKNKLKIIIICLCFLIGMTFIGLLSSFLPYIMFFVSSLKCILWISENYESYHLTTDIPTVDKKSFSNGIGLIDIVEYYVAAMVSYILSCVVTIISYFFFPFISQILIIVFGITILAEKSYRQKCCSLVQKLLGYRQKGADGNYIHTYSSIYNLLKKIDLAIESSYLIVYRIVQNPKNIYNNLNNADNIMSGVQIIINGNKCLSDDLNSGCDLNSLDKLPDDDHDDKLPVNDHVDKLPVNDHVNKLPVDKLVNNKKTMGVNNSIRMNDVEILDDILDEVY